MRTTVYWIIITGVLLATGYSCFAGEKEELELKLAYYGEVIRRAQYEVMLAAQESDKVKTRLDALSQIDEQKKVETKKEEIKK